MDEQNRQAPVHYMHTHPIEMVHTHTGYEPKDKTTENPIQEDRLEIDGHENDLLSLGRYFVKKDNAEDEAAREALREKNIAEAAKSEKKRAAAEAAEKEKEAKMRLLRKKRRRR